MQEYLQIVGKGKKSARDLTADEARRAAALLLQREATDVQIGAFLQAERIKGESVAELLAFVQELRARSFLLPPLKKEVLDCSGPFDGRSKTFIATLPASLILAALGVPVVLYGNETLPPKKGVGLLDLAGPLGLYLPSDAKTAAEMLERENIVLLPAESFSPPLARLRPLRLELGFRTLLNTVEKCLNLAGATYAVTGVFHTPALEKMAQLLQEMGYRRALVVQGEEGSEDLPCHRPATVYLVDKDRLEKRTLKPKEFGLSQEMKEGPLTVEEQVKGISEILQGNSHPFRDMVLFNAGVRLWLTEKCASPEEGIAQAKVALDSGKAWQKWRDWQALAR